MREKEERGGGTDRGRIALKVGGSRGSAGYTSVFEGGAYDRSEG